jgi:hypothetical protein
LAYRTLPEPLDGRVTTVILNNENELVKRPPPKNLPEFGSDGWQIDNRLLG